MVLKWYLNTLSLSSPTGAAVTKSVLLSNCVLVCWHAHLCVRNESSVESNCFSHSYFSRAAYRPLQPWLKLFSCVKSASASNFHLPGVISHSLPTEPYHGFATIFRPHVTPLYFSFFKMTSTFSMNSTHIFANRSNMDEKPTGRTNNSTTKRRVSG